MAISPTNIRILFTNYDIITYFLNLASCSEHFISIKHRILATFNIKKINLSDCMPLIYINILYVKAETCQMEAVPIYHSFKIKNYFVHLELA
jgi:hypothetical protein